MVEGAEGTVTAEGGRRIGYAVSGDPRGRPVVFCHGGSGSRRMELGTPEMQARAGVRHVAIERPGFGLSDGRLGWRLLDWPGDVDVVARHLHIDSYGVVGFSAGGRCALACGVARPDAVTRVDVVAGVLPPSWYPDDELVALAARDLDAATRQLRRHIEGFAADVDATVEAMGTVPGPDGPIYQRPEIRALFLATYREAFRSGIDGAVHDALLSNVSWGFDLADLAVPVHWWHGTDDRLTPGPIVQRAIGHLPGHTLTLYKGEGHAIGFTHAEDILATIGAVP